VKKGVSLIVLIITIIIMITLTGVVIINYNNAIGNTAKTQLQLDIVQLESLMNTYRIRKNGNIGFETVKFNTANLSSLELEQFEGENIVSGIIELYIIDLYAIDAEAVNYGNSKKGVTDRYLYSMTTGKVYYEHGLLDQDRTYYHIENGD